MLKKLLSLAFILCFSDVHATDVLRKLSVTATGANVSQTVDASVAVAHARVLEMESLTQLTAEGAALYRSDNEKKTGMQYCGESSALSAKGEFRRAIREAEKALFLGLTTKDEDLLAHVKRDLAIAYSYSGNLEKAEVYAQQALKHTVEWRHRAAVYGRAYKVLGDVSMRRGDPLAAIEMYQKSVDLAEDDFRFFSRASLASAFAAAQQMDKARAMQSKADSYVAVVGPRSKAGAEATSFRLKADIAMRDGRFNDAAKMFADALNSDSATDGSDVPHQKFRAYEGIATAKAASGDKLGALKAYQDAIGASENVRARFRSEEITSGLFGQMQNVFNQAISLLMESGQSEIAFDISEQGRARALLDMVRNRISLSSGSSVFVDSLAKSVSASEISASLKSDDVMVEYHVTDKKTYVWLLRSSGMVGMTLDIDRSQLVNQVEDLRNALSTQKTGSSLLGSQLYDALVRPLQLKPGESLIIVPHDALHYLPFQALQSEGVFLIERFPISYVPSASTFVAITQRELAKKGSLLALGNPDLGDPNLSLPGAQVEVENIKALFPDSEAYFQSEATKERMLEGAGKARLVHIAAHALADSVDPLYSQVYLAGSNGKSGSLEAREVYGINLSKTALVTLSACQSGLGKVTQGDEIWGFTRSFLSAGSSSVLVSLWSVSDDATEMLMTKFYQGLSTTNARQALRSAQIAVSKDKRFSHPFYWAPFNLVGDWR